MSDYKTVNSGSGLGGDIRTYADGEIIIDGQPYGRYDGRHINPYVYGNPTLIIDDYGYIKGAYDGVTYGKIITFGNKITGVETYVSPFNGGGSSAPARSTDSSEGIAVHLMDAIANRTEKPKTVGYSNGHGSVKKGKKIAIIVICVYLAIALLMFLGSMLLE